jgi:hypothetical protein
LDVRSSGLADIDSLYTINTYIIIPVIVAKVVPIGIEREGFLSSPDNPTPAVIPVKAGKTMAKTMKKLLKSYEACKGRVLPLVIP